MIESGRSEAAIMAIVHSADGIRYVVTGGSASDVASRVADYVRQRCDHVLWPAAASQVRAMLDCGDVHAAISLYFDHVGERWDEERLELMSIPDGRALSIFEEGRMAGA